MKEDNTEEKILTEKEFLDEQEASKVRKTQKNRKIESKVDDLFDESERAFESEQKTHRERRFHIDQNIDLKSDDIFDSFEKDKKLAIEQKSKTKEKAKAFDVDIIGFFVQIGIVLCGIALVVDIILCVILGAMILSGR